MPLVWSDYRTKYGKEGDTMSRLRFSIAFPAALILANAAVAGEQPIPRSPIGPNPIVQEMLPPAADLRLPTLQPSPLPEDRIRVQNIGNQHLFIAYWDGQSAWRDVSVESGRTTDVVCPKCSGTIAVTYHNGREKKSVTAKGGSTYILGWSPQAGVWIFTSSASR
jgi:hypothetical protein